MWRFAALLDTSMRASSASKGIRRTPSISKKASEYTLCGRRGSLLLA